jgi:hypothetical protein
MTISDIQVCVDSQGIFVQTLVAMRLQEYGTTGVHMYIRREGSQDVLNSAQLLIGTGWVDQGRMIGLI